MKKILVVGTAVTLMLGAVVAHAEGTRGGLGFRTLNGADGALSNLGVGFSASPAIGIRQWFNEQVGLDVGIGFTSLTAEINGTDVDEGSGFAIDVGVPFAAKKWDRVSFIIRPGFLYGTATATDKLALGPPDELESTTFSVSGEFEVEFMLADNLSVSAAHGIAYRSITLKDNDTPENEAKVTGFETVGDNFTQLGFHVYLW